MSDLLIDHGIVEVAPEWIKAGAAVVEVRALRGAATRWIGRCKVCKSGVRIHGVAIAARAGVHDVAMVLELESRLAYGCRDGWDGTTHRKCACGAWVKLSRVFVGKKQSDAACGATCQSATGPSCDCRCRGANHGSSY